MSNDAVPPPDLGPSLVPLRAYSPYGGNSGDVLRRQAARPDTWREAWPDDPRVIQVRDLLTAHFRRAYHFEADSFLPDDTMNAIMIGADLDEFHDELEFVMAIEEALDVKIDDEAAQKMRGQTYMEFIESLLPQLSPEYLLRPLVLPAGYFKSGWWSSFKRWLGRGIRHHELRNQQSRRTPDWVETWADYEPLIELRDRVGRILADKLDWPAPAFVPDDQLAAIFLHRGGPKKALAAIQALNRELNLDLLPESVVSGGWTFLDFLRYIDGNSRKRE